jgi:hypothetical protein
MNVQDENKAVENSVDEIFAQTIPAKSSFKGLIVTISRSLQPSKRKK